MESTRYIDKYNTPRVFHISTTIGFVILVGLMLSVTVIVTSVTTYNPKTWSINTWEYTRDTVFEMFEAKVDSTGFLLGAVALIASIAGIVFIWLNRPKLSAICAGILLIIMFLSLLVIGDLGMEDYFASWNDYDRLEVRVQETYYLLWGLTIILIVFSIISIKTTKEGPRPPKLVRIVESPAASQPSAADELKKYKELLDSGVITQEEFQEKKKQLLNL